jgi:hypothetical protein
MVKIEFSTNLGCACSEKKLIAEFEDDMTIEDINDYGESWAIGLILNELSWRIINED